MLLILPYCYFDLSPHSMYTPLPSWYAHGITWTGIAQSSDERSSGTAEDYAERGEERHACGRVRAANRSTDRQRGGDEWTGRWREEDGRESTIGSGRSQAVDRESDRRAHVDVWIWMIDRWLSWSRCARALRRSRMERA